MVGFATIAGLALMLGGAITPASADAPCRDIRKDLRDIRRDRIDIRQDQRQIGRLDGRLRYDVNHDKFGAAEHVVVRINHDRNDVRRDRADVRHDVRDLRHDI
jgi:hypothetical protein